MSYLGLKRARLCSCGNITDMIEKLTDDRTEKALDRGEFLQKVAAKVHRLRLDGRVLRARIDPRNVPINVRGSDFAIVCQRRWHG